MVCPKPPGEYRLRDEYFRLLHRIGTILGRVCLGRQFTGNRYAVIIVAFEIVPVGAFRLSQPILYKRRIRHRSSQTRMPPFQHLVASPVPDRFRILRSCREVCYRRILGGARTGCHEHDDALKYLVPGTVNLRKPVVIQTYLSFAGSTAGPGNQARNIPGTVIASPESDHQNRPYGVPTMDRCDVQPSMKFV